VCVITKSVSMTGGAVCAVRFPVSLRPSNPRVPEISISINHLSKKKKPIAEIIKGRSFLTLAPVGSPMTNYTRKLKVTDFNNFHSESHSFILLF
jgi:hypothetical protein